MYFSLLIYTGFQGIEVGVFLGVVESKGNDLFFLEEKRNVKIKGNDFNSGKP